MSSVEHIDAASQTPADRTDVYGLLALGGMEVAFPLSSLREVVPAPDHFSRVPAQAPGFLGAMELRGSIVPVVDARPIIGIAADEQHVNEIVVVITDGHHVLGVLADQLRGVAQIASSALLPVQAAEGQLFFSHAFLHGTDHRQIVSVLSVDALINLPGIPLVEQAGGLGVIADVSAVYNVNAGDKYTLVKCGPHYLALDIAQVHTTIPSCETKPSVLSSDLCWGVTSYFGQDVPVIDPLQLLGLGRMSRDDRGPGLVLKFDTGYVVLALSSLLELSDLAAEDIRPLPTFAVQRPEFFAGMADTSTGFAMVLDGYALMAHHELLAHAAMNTASDTAQGADAPPAEGNQAGAVRGDAHLVYSVGVNLATPLDHVAEILPLVRDELTETNAEYHVLGVLSHRDFVMPVICLRTVLGLEPITPTPKSCLLVVAQGERRVALAVDELQGIENLAWQDVDSDVVPATHRSELLQTLQRSPLIQVGSSTQLLPQIDLNHLVRLLGDDVLSDGSMSELAHEIEPEAPHFLH